VDEIKDKADELIEIIKTRFVNTDGLLARNYPTQQRTLFDNFDDLAPFFVYFGEEDFLLSQIHTIQERGETMLTLCSSGEGIITRRLDEWFGGLYTVWRATKDTKTFALLSESVDFVLTHLFVNDNLSGGFNLRTGQAELYYEPWSSGLLEVFCEMRDDFPQAFEKALRVMHNWVNDDYFKQYSLFPYRMFFSSLDSTCKCNISEVGRKRQAAVVLASNTDQSNKEHL
jgi:hypothetical protein